MQIQLKRILFPTDFSEPAEQAKHYAISLTERFGAELHLLHVVPQVMVPLPESSSSWTMPEADQQAQLEVANARLLKEVGTEWADQHHIVRTAMIGYAVEDIVKYAKDRDIDLIVIGTHGHTGFSHLLLGSVAEKIVRLATCPVLTIHPKGHQFVSDEGAQVESLVQA